jgi:hypothetical protein
MVLVTDRGRIIFVVKRKGDITDFGSLAEKNKESELFFVMM